MKKQQVLYIHGGEAFLNHEDFMERLKTIDLWHMPGESAVASTKKWTSSLAEELGDEYEVIMPPMPNKQNAKYEEWSIWFERHFEYLGDGAILMGCSLGAMFLAKYLSNNNLPFKPKAVILMAGLYPSDDIKPKDCGDFIVHPEDTRPILKKSDRTIIMHSKDDFLVPYQHGEALATALPEAEFITFEDKNHFLIEEFPELIEKIQEIAVK
jgi:predicted alpha/beta hydrolase family esterase